MRINGLVIWYLAGAIAVVAVGWVAAMIHASGYAPVGLVSIGVGALLGAVLGGLAAYAGVTATRQLVVGAVLAAILTVVAEHAWLYHDYCGQWRESRVKTPQVALFRPESPPPPTEYFSRELATGQGGLWCLDAVLITTSSIATILFAKQFWTSASNANGADSSLSGTLNPKP